MMKKVLKIFVFVPIAIAFVMFALSLVEAIVTAIREFLGVISGVFSALNPFSRDKKKRNLP